MKPLLLVVIGLAAAAANAQAQDARPWLIRVEAGSAEIHRFVPDPQGIIVGVRVAHIWKNDLVRVDFGVARSSADRGFFTADAGVELRLCNAGCRVAPYVGAAFGSLVEPIYGDSRMSRAGGGIEIRLSPNQLLRVGIQRGRHGRDARGPHLITVGWSHRFVNPR